MSIDIGKRLCILRALSRTVFHQALYLVCCASITGCTGVVTVHVKSKIKDVYMRDYVHSVQNASIEDGYLKVCVSASNSREIDPVNYTLNIPYKKIPSWYEDAKEVFYKRNPGNAEFWPSMKPRWAGPNTNEERQPCENKLTSKQVKVINIARLTESLYSDYLGWYLNDGDENTINTNKEKAAEVMYKNEALMLNDIFKSGVIENETVAVISQVITGSVKTDTPYVWLYYFDPVLKYSNTSYFKFAPPFRLVKGNKILYLLLPFTYLVDTFTFPVQIMLFLNSTH